MKSYVHLSFQCHVNTAKEMLYHFSERSTDEDLETILLEAGLNNNTKTVRLVRKSEKSPSELQCLTSKHVYALGKRLLFENGDQVCKKSSLRCFFILLTMNCRP